MSAWNIDLQWDGRRWAWSDLAVEVREDMDVMAGRPVYRPRRFTFEAPAGDILSWMRAGHTTATARCVVRFGDRILSTSPITAIEPGHAGQTTVFTVAEEPAVDVATIPPEHDMAVRRLDKEATQQDEERWQQEFEEKLNLLYDVMPTRPLNYEIQVLPPMALYADEIIGQTYTMVFGKPGEGDTACYPGAMIDTSTKSLMIAGHQVNAGTVVVLVANGETVQSAEFTVLHRRDEQGRVIAYVDLAEVTDYPATDDLEYSVAFNGTASGLPGNAADVLRTLVSLTRGVRVDVASVATLRGRLSGWYLSRFVNAKASPWQMMMEELLPLMPVACVPTPWGAGFVYIDLEATAADAKLSIDVGPSFAPRWDRFKLDTAASSITTAWNLRYGLRMRKNGPSYREAVRLDPDTSGVSAAASSANGYLVDQIDTPWAYRSSTASLMARHLLRRTSVRRPALDYQARPEVYGVEGTHPLLHGDIVQINDPQRNFVGVVMIVGGIRRYGEDLRVTLYPVNLGV